MRVANSRVGLLLLLTAASSSAGAGSSAGSYTNPVIGSEDSPDPGVAYDPVTGLWWHATTSGNAADAFPIRSSADLATWTDVGHVFPQGHKPAWGVSDYWAPEFHLVQGRWLVYFVARTAAGQLSVGVAQSTGVGPNGTSSIAGPFVDALGSPLITDSIMGQIDPTFYADIDGRQYLIWKEDGNAVGQHTPIHIAELTANGTALMPGQQDWHSTQLITNDLPWEGGVTEAPWVVRYAESYMLFYSGSGYTSGYAVGVARATSIRGPYTKFGPPILHEPPSNPQFECPGHCSVVQALDGNWAMVYHAWPGSDRSHRMLMLDSVQWVQNTTTGLVWPAVGNGVPSTTAQPVP